MTDLTVSVCRLVKGNDEHQLTLPAGADITQGQLIYPDSNGKWALADASAAGTAGDVYVAPNTVKAGNALTGLRGPCVVDLGTAIATLAVGARVYLSNTAGTMADAAGDTSKIVGTVIPSWAKTTVEKLLRLDL
jgi:hypothetical protein